jgi:gas vesicle protein
MKSETESKVPYLAVGIAVGAVGSLIAAALARKETREKVLERGSKSLDYLKERGQKLRETSKVAIEKGRNFIGCKCHESAQENPAGERQANGEEKREVMGE